MNEFVARNEWSLIRREMEWQRRRKRVHEAKIAYKRDSIRIIIMRMTDDRRECTLHASHNIQCQRAIIKTDKNCVNYEGQFVCEWLGRRRRRRRMPGHVGYLHFKFIARILFSLLLLLSSAMNGNRNSNALAGRPASLALSFWSKVKMMF